MKEPFFWFCIFFFIFREGEVGVFNHKERRTKKRYLFLFNDILLITKKEGKKSYWLKIFISLKSNLRIEDVPDSATRYKGNCYNIIM